MKMTKTSSPTHQVVIAGAGPYGLAAAAHLRPAKAETCVFGEPMEFWESRMAKGMLLRSSWDASDIADPHRTATLDAYSASQRTALPKPVPLDRFVGCGRWQVDVSRYPFLKPELVRTLRLNDGYPELRGGFESSVPGLHFLGAPVARSLPALPVRCGDPFCRALAHAPDSGDDHAPDSGDERLSSERALKPTAKSETR